MAEGEGQLLNLLSQARTCSEASLSSILEACTSVVDGTCATLLEQARAAAAAGSPTRARALVEEILQAQMLVELGGAHRSSGGQAFGEPGPGRVSQDDAEQEHLDPSLLSRGGGNVQLSMAQFQQLLSQGSAAAGAGGSPGYGMQPPPPASSQQAQQERPRSYGRRGMPDPQPVRSSRRLAQLNAGGDVVMEGEGSLSDWVLVQITPPGTSVPQLCRVKGDQVETLRSQGLRIQVVEEPQTGEEAQEPTPPPSQPPPERTTRRSSGTAAAGSIGMLGKRGQAEPSGGGGMGSQQGEGGPYGGAAAMGASPGPPMPKRSARTGSSASLGAYPHQGTPPPAPQPSQQQQGPGRGVHLGAGPGPQPVSPGLEPLPPGLRYAYVQEPGKAERTLVIMKEPQGPGDPMQVPTAVPLPMGPGQGGARPPGLGPPPPGPMHMQPPPPPQQPHMGSHSIPYGHPQPHGPPPGQPPPGPPPGAGMGMPAPGNTSSSSAASIPRPGQYMMATLPDGRTVMVEATGQKISVGRQSSGPTPVPSSQGPPPPALVTHPSSHPPPPPMQPPPMQGMQVAMPGMPPPPHSSQVAPRQHMAPAPSAPPQSMAVDPTSSTEVFSAVTIAQLMLLQDGRMVMTPPDGQPPSAPLPPLAHQVILTSQGMMCLVPVAAAGDEVGQMPGGVTGIDASGQPVTLSQQPPPGSILQSGQLPPGAVPAWGSPMPAPPPPPQAPPGTVYFVPGGEASMASAGAPVYGSHHMGAPPPSASQTSVLQVTTPARPGPPYYMQPSPSKAPGPPPAQHQQHGSSMGSAHGVPYGSSVLAAGAPPAPVAHRHSEGAAGYGPPGPGGMPGPPGAPPGAAAGPPGQAPAGSARASSGTVPPNMAVVTLPDGRRVLVERVDPSSLPKDFQKQQQQAAAAKVPSLVTPPPGLPAIAAPSTTSGGLTTAQQQPGSAGQQPRASGGAQGGAAQHQEEGGGGGVPAGSEQQQHTHGSSQGGTGGASSSDRAKQGGLQSGGSLSPVMLDQPPVFGPRPPYVKAPAETGGQQQQELVPWVSRLFTTQMPSSGGRMHLFTVCSELPPAMAAVLPQELWVVDFRLRSFIPMASAEGPPILFWLAPETVPQQVHALSKLSENKVGAIVQLEDGREFVLSPQMVEGKVVLAGVIITPQGPGEDPYGGGKTGEAHTQVGPAKAEPAASSGGGGGGEVAAQAGGPSTTVAQSSEEAAGGDCGEGGAEAVPGKAGGEEAGAGAAEEEAGAEKPAASITSSCEDEGAGKPAGAAEEQQEPAAAAEQAEADAGKQGEEQEAAEEGDAAKRGSKTKAGAGGAAAEGGQKPEAGKAEGAAPGGQKGPGKGKGMSKKAGSNN